MIIIFLFIFCCFALSYILAKFFDKVNEINCEFNSQFNEIDYPDTIEEDKEQ